MNNVLKKRREELGKDINEIAEITRIKRSYLRAIEEDDFEKLPVEVYTKGYIREYAEFLAIPMEQAFEPYERYLEERRGAKGPEKKRTEMMPEQEHPEVAAVPSLPPETGFGEEERSASSASRKILWTVLFLFLAGLAGFYLLRSGVREAPLPPLPSPRTEPAPSPSVPPGDATGNALPESPAVQPALPETTSSPPAGGGGKPESRDDVLKKSEQSTPAEQRAKSPEPSGAPAAGPARAAAAHSLDISAKGRTWLQIVIDGSGKKEIILNPGEKVAYRVNENASVLIGNAAGVLLKFDGRQYEGLGGEGEVVRMDFPAAVASPVSPARKSAPGVPSSQPVTPESPRP
ncbi:MAG: DUF4115 domain-containing protein [Thermodesulfovibrionales bacterium]